MSTALINALVHRDYLVNGSEVHIDILDDRMEIYSPGGMADGIAIQDRDPLSVPSTRRNPLLADIFERLGYMERKGSGFGKILDAYEFQVNYKEDKKPSFRSDRASFFTIMPNLNYLGDNVAHNVAHDVAQTLAEIIAEEIQKDNKVTREQIAVIANVSKKTVERELKKMNNVRYVESGSNGHWEITD